VHDRIILLLPRSSKSPGQICFRARDWIRFKLAAMGAPCPSSLKIGIGLVNVYLLAVASYEEKEVRDFWFFLGTTTPITIILQLLPAPLTGEETDLSYLTIMFTSAGWLLRKNEAKHPCSKQERLARICRNRCLVWFGPVRSGLNWTWSLITIKYFLRFPCHKWKHLQESIISAIPNLFHLPASIDVFIFFL